MSIKGGWRTNEQIMIEDLEVAVKRWQILYDKMYKERNQIAKEFEEFKEFVRNAYQKLPP